MNPKNFTGTMNVFLHSFFIQAFWNFERIQNVGFAYCIYPFLKKIYPDKEKRCKAILRHLEFFCTHPYMVNLVLGLVVSMEERLASGDESIQENHISQIKLHLSGPLAALGDSFFWSFWRSFCAITASSIYFFTANKTDTAPAVFSVFLFLVIYNMLHIPVRWFGFSLAYSQGMQIIATIERLRVLNWGRMIAPVSMTWLCIMLIAYLVVSDGGWWQKLLLLSFFMVLYGFKNRETSTIKVLYITIFVCVLLTYFGFAMRMPV